MAIRLTFFVWIMFMILCCICAVSAFVIPIPYDQNININADNSWQLLLLVQQWPGTSKNPLPPAVNGFTIHGLWPERNDASYPQNCNNIPFNITSISALVPQLNINWPSYMGPSETFWCHEWEKHGTCSINAAALETQYDYFNATLTLLADLAIAPVFQKAGITPGSSTYSLSAMQTALYLEFGQDFPFQCQSGSIYQIINCISPTLKLITCPSAVYNSLTGGSYTCPSSVKYPVIPH